MLLIIKLTYSKLLAFNLRYIGTVKIMWMREREIKKDPPRKFSKILVHKNALYNIQKTK
jgi:hypothetical protein